MREVACERMLALEESTPDELSKTLQVRNINFQQKP